MRWPTHLLTVDFETFWSADFTLKKLSTEEYVRSPQFQPFGASVKYGDAPSRWIDAEQLPAFFAGVPWHDTALLCQNAQFDGAILSHHYGVIPALYLCTLAMARMALPRQRHSLEKLAEHFGLPAKFDMLHLTKGLRELPPDVRAQLAARACRDGDLTREVFKRLLPAIPTEELRVIDLTVRLFTQPRLTLDRQKARNLLAKVIRNKRSACQRLGVTKEMLASADKFAELLVDRFGIEPAAKMGKRGLIPALAKNDPFMKALLEHDNPDVQALAALRMSVKSTLEETRLRRLLSMHTRGPLAVFLNFAGAHTMRWSGGDKMNWQNFPAGRDGREPELRRCIRAPEGQRIVVADLSQIEARVLNTLAGQWDVLELFEKGDPYSAMASDMYDRLINKRDHPAERQTGKGVELGCGFGMGPPKLRETLRKAGVVVDLEFAERGVKKYRKRHPRVVEYWGVAETAIQLLHARVENQPWGPMVIDRGYIRHAASGVALDYTGLVREEGEWRMRDRAGNLMLNQFGYPIRLYGGLMTENVVQWLARMVMAQAMPAIAERFPLVMTTHDELVALASKERADECLAFMVEHMTKRPAWLPQIPLAAEGGYDECYSK